MDALKILADYHEEWVKIVRFFGGKDYAEDVVHDVYLRIIEYKYEEKIIKDGKPNIALMWVMLRNMTFLTNKMQRLELYPLDDVRGLADDESELPKQEALERLHLKIEDEISNWHWYDAMLFKVYKESKASMRDIAKDSGISLTSIFNTLKNCKQRLKDNVGEDYEDYGNNDFDLI